MPDLVMSSSCHWPLPPEDVWDMWISIVYREGRMVWDMCTRCGVYGNVQEG